MSFKTRIQNKRDTASNWETNNPVLLDGELIVVDTNAGDIRFKIGDGTKTYTQLPFQDEVVYNALSGKADANDLTVLESRVTTIDGEIDALQSEIAEKQDALTFDETPTEGSSNPVTSGGIKSYVDSAQIQADLSETDNSANDYVKGIIRQESLPVGYPYKKQVTTSVEKPLNITWGGSTTGLQSATYSFYKFYRVSNKVLTDEQIRASTLTYSTGTTISVADQWDDMVQNGNVTGDYVCVGSSMVVIRRGGVKPPSTSYIDTSFPVPGVYFVRILEDNYLSSLSTFEIWNKLETVIEPMAEEFLPESATAQSDWNQKDESKPDFIKNRPFYTINNDEVIVDKETIEVEDTGYDAFAHDVHLIEGQTYVVDFNGTVYECVAWLGASNSIYLGNGDIYGGEGMGGNEPFSIQHYPNSKLAALHVNTGFETFVISITKIDREVVKIPEEYLPSHTHDDRYYTEAETYSQEEVDAAIDAAVTGHAHSDIYYTKVMIDSKDKAINNKISNMSKTITEQNIDTAFNDIFGGE